METMERQVNDRALLAAHCHGQLRGPSEVISSSFSSFLEASSCKLVLKLFFDVLIAQYTAAPCLILKNSLEALENSYANFIEYLIAYSSFIL